MQIRLLIAALGFALTPFTTILAPPAAATSGPGPCYLDKATLQTVGLSAQNAQDMYDNPKKYAGIPWCDSLQGVFLSADLDANGNHIIDALEPAPTPSASPVPSSSPVPTPAQTTSAAHVSPAPSPVVAKTPTPTVAPATTESPSPAVLGTQTNKPTLKIASASTTSPAVKVWVVPFLFALALTGITGIWWLRRRIKQYNRNKIS